jgi:hypothetical protein
MLDNTSYKSNNKQQSPSFTQVKRETSTKNIRNKEKEFLQKARGMSRTGDNAFNQCGSFKSSPF